MIKTVSRVGEARQRVIVALQDAYGRTQTTPDGPMCRMGRIDRAYQMKVGANGNADKYQIAIGKLQEEALIAFAEADKLTATYVRLCKQQNIAADIDIPACDCTYCRGEFTGRMNHEDWQRFITVLSAPIGAN